MMEDPPAERLRQVIQAIDEDEALGGDWMKREGVLAVLEQVADHLDDQAQAQAAYVTNGNGKVPVSTCARRGLLRTDEPCDRPPRHKGMCSWEAERWQATAHEYELSARQLPETRARLATAEAKVRRLTRELETEHLRREATRSARARQAAEERG